MSGHAKIIVHSRQPDPWLCATLDSILAHTRYPSFEVLLVTSTGEDPTGRELTANDACRGVTFHRAGATSSLGSALNDSVTHRDADWYVFVRGGCILEEDDWLTRGVRTLEREPRASMVHPEIVEFAYDGDLRFEETPARERTRSLRRVCSLIWAWPYEDVTETWEADSECSSDAPHEVMAGSGAVGIFRARMFHRLGGYDAEATGHLPEGLALDYCLRSWLLGHATIFDPSVRVRRRVPAPGDGEASPTRDVVHSCLRTTYKYLSPRRRDVAEDLFRGHGADVDLDWALGKIREGHWLSERARHLRVRARDDDWLFSTFAVYEHRFGAND